jgi:hypothetical protein
MVPEEVNRRRSDREQTLSDIQVMSFGDQLIFAKTSIGWTPVRCARERRTVARISKRILQLKGLMRGVPPNTERTTVKPWVGSASWQEVFVLC